MASKREAAENMWEQLNEKMTPAQKRSMQRLSDAFNAYKGDRYWGRYNELRTSLILAAMEGTLGFVPVKTIDKTNTVLGLGRSENDRYWYVLCTSPEEAVLCPEEILTVMKLDTIVTKAIQDKEIAGVWLNPYGGHKCSITKEDLALYRAMADLGVLDNRYHELYCNPGRTETEDGKPQKIGEGRHAGVACIMVYEEGIGELNHPFWDWLRNEGFHTWGQHGNFGMNWVFINLNSMEYAPGMPGVRLATPIREHAITMDEFRTIWEIFKKYEGLGPLVMLKKEKPAGKLITMNDQGEMFTTELTGEEWDKMQKTGEMPQKTVNPPRPDDTFSVKYIQALLERITTDEMINEHEKLLEGKTPVEQKKIKDRLALDIFAECPYKPLIELEHRDNLREKHIDEKNWLQHLDEMTNEEIMFMLEQLPGKDNLNRHRYNHPEISDRTRAEMIRDF